MVLEDQRSETPFSARDNMLDIWKHVTELSFRGFGKRKRKPDKVPKNFETWSEASQERWKQNTEQKASWREQWDIMFINRESNVVDTICRKIVYLIDRANTLNPQYLSECDEQRKMQNEAIGYCNNLKRELNHIADTIPCNKNFLVILTRDIDKEIAVLRGWRKSCNVKRKEVLEKEIKQRADTAEKLGFIIAAEDVQTALNTIQTLE